MMLLGFSSIGWGGKTKRGKCHAAAFDFRIMAKRSFFKGDITRID
jgi:hypothetical protein